MEERILVAGAMVVKDGELTVEQSIVSLSDCVSRVYVVDHGSTDATVRILEELSEKIDNLVVIDGSDMTYAEARQTIIDRAEEKYLLKWDADFVALRHKFLAKVDFGEILNKALKKMEEKELNLCLFRAKNIGFGLDTVIENRPFIGLSGDIRMYKRSVAKYKVGKYADEFSIVGEEPKRLYFNQESIDWGILHLDYLKAPQNIALRNVYFEYDIKFAEGETQLGFNEWLKTRISTDLNEFIESQIINKKNVVKFDDELIYLLQESDFYRSLHDSSPYLYGFDNQGLVNHLRIKR